MYSFFISKNFSKNFFKKNTDLKKKIDKLQTKTNIQLFLQICLKSGNKLKTLSFLNKVVFNFYTLFTKKTNIFFKKFNNFTIFENFSKREKKFFDINFLMQLILNINEVLFTTQAVRVDKKTKQKNKTKYSAELIYIKKHKRPVFVLKQLYLNSNNYNYYTFDQRILMSFVSSFFLEKGSDIYKNKIRTYQNILKKNSK